jgi:hypothetical protein
VSPPKRHALQIFTIIDRPWVELLIKLEGVLQDRPDSDGRF